MGAATGTLGCANAYAVEILQVTGRTAGGTPTLRTAWAFEPGSGLSGLSWSRSRAETSAGTVTIDLAGAGTGCCETVDALQPWLTEIRIWRDGVPVWEGPMVDEPRTAAGTVTFEAFDVSIWLEDLANLIDMSYTDQALCSVASDIITVNLNDDTYSIPNDYPIMADYVEPLDVLPLIDYAPGLVAEYVSDTIADLRQYGLDWTVLGRSLLLYRRKTTDAPPVARLGTGDFATGFGSTIVGSDIATYGWGVKDGADESAPPTMVGYGATGSPYGRHDVITTVSDPNASNASLRRAARNAISGLTVPHVEVDMDDAAVLAPAAPVTIDQLVPGWRFDVFTTTGCTNLRQASLLETVETTWAPGAEQVAVAFTALGDPVIEPASEGDGSP